MAEPARVQQSCPGAFRSLLDRIGLGTLVSIYHCLFEALWRVKDAIILVFVVVFLFAVWFLHLYKGVLAHVCVKTHHHHLYNSNATTRRAHYSNSSHWLKSENGYYEYCGTLYGSKQCPDGYVCMEDVGPVPSHHYTTYNSISSSYLAILVIAMNDYWEWLCQLVLLYKGKWNIIAFIAVIITTYCALATIFCTIYAAFNKVWKQNQKRQAKAKLAAKLKGSGANTPIYRSASRVTAYAEDGLFDEVQVEPEPQPTVAVVKTCWQSFKDVFCVWQCCLCCDRCKAFFHTCVFNPIFPTIVSMCIIFNLATMVAENIYRDFIFEELTHYSQIVFSAIYNIELILKFAALGPKGFFGDNWNCYEFVVVLIMDSEILSTEIGFGVFYLSFFFMLFRLGRFCPSIGRLTKMSNRAFKIQFNFIFVLIAFTLLMAVIGYEGFGPSPREYTNSTTDILGDDNIWGWHMNNYFTSFMMVSRAICGEWVNNLWECSYQNGWTCVPFFLVTVVIGNLLLLNLFTFFLLAEISTMIDEEVEVPPSLTIKVMADGVDCFVRIWTAIRNKLGLESSRYRRAGLDDPEIGNRVIESVSTENLVEDNIVYLGLDENEQVVFTNGNGPASITEPGPCCPNLCFRLPFCAFGCGGGSFCWYRFRKLCFAFMNTKSFEIGTTVIIVTSTILLTLEDINLRYNPKLKETLFVPNVLIAVLFTIELSIRLIGSGIKDYFSSMWRLWDFLIILGTILSCLDLLFTHDGIPMLRCLRVLRLLRLLNIAWQFESARITANTLIESFPGMINVFVFGFLIWMVFAFIMTNAFNGWFSECLDHLGNRIYDFPMDSCVDLNYTWYQMDLNFDDIFESFMTLTQIATIKNWDDVVAKGAISLTGIGSAHYFIVSTLLFGLFIVFGAYYTYILWLSTIIDGFNRQRKRTELISGFTGLGDRIYHRAMKFIAVQKPKRLRNIVLNKVQDTSISTVEDVKFDVAVSILITVNIISLALPHYLQSENFDIVLKVVDSLFIVVFSGEVILRIVAFRLNFLDNWVNIMDVIIVFLAIISIANQNIVSHYVLPPTLLRLVRLYKILRFRKWYKPLKGLTILVDTLVELVPYLMFVAFFFTIIMIVYAILGMFLFKDIQHAVKDLEDFHFQTFGNALVVLGQLFVSSGWDSFITPLRDRTKCTLETEEACHSKMVPFLYMGSFLLITYATMFTLLTVLVLQLFNQLRLESKVGVSLEDCSERFYTIWTQYDPSRTGYLKLRDLASFVGMQQDVFWLSKPNSYEIAIMDIPIMEGDLVYHKDILDALYRSALSKKGFPVSGVEIFEDYDKPNDAEIISTTLWRKKEEHCANVIKKAWAKYKKDQTH